MDWDSKNTTLSISRSVSPLGEFLSTLKKTVAFKSGSVKPSSNETKEKLRPTGSVSIFSISSISKKSPRTRSDFLRRQTVLLTLYVWSVLISVVIMAPVGASIDCFKCVSLNGNNPSCEDPFHNNYSSSILESPCMGGRKGRNGLFPATACIKLTGTYYDNGETVVVRGCALDSNTLTTDTEIIRMSHCGGLELDDRYVKGCLQSCDDADGCNFAPRPTSSKSSVIIICLAALFIIFYPGTISNLPIFNYL